MKVSVIGTGYVGLVTGACLAELGMNVLCMDTDQAKIKKLKSGIVPIYEPGLNEIIAKNTSENKLNFTTDFKETIAHGEVIFIAVGTPTLEDDTSDLQYVFSAANEIATYMNSYKVIVTKSTVPVNTGLCIKKTIRDLLDKQNKSIDFDVVSNPEFLREGTAVNDFMKPDRIVIGAQSTKAIQIMKSIYSTQMNLKIPLITTNIETSEMIKYAANAFLSAKISFINEIANLCDLCNADISIVAAAMGLDKRIGPEFLNAGPGYGGSCFPKDTKALIGIGKNLGYVPLMIESTIEVNDNQPKIMVEKLKKLLFNIDNKVITILGVAFKPETDDIREAPAIKIIKQLLQNGCNIKAYDPEALENLKKFYPDLNIEYCRDAYSACTGSDCIVLVTDWAEFKSLDFTKIKSLINTPALLDLRNIYNADYIKSLGFVYEGVGRK